MLNEYLEISPEVTEALTKGRPVVALESTIIAFGMPYPQNVETALNCEKIVRENGAVPATIAIIGGKIKVGLSIADIKVLAEGGPEAIKTSRRDIAYVVSQKLAGATTVSTTMFAARLAGIKVFATGGIGGVHREASTTFDISADLEELAQTDVAVVCAGFKSILDLPKTMEYLETKGVPVIGYQTGILPAFYTEESGCSVNYNLKTPEGVASFIKVKWDLGLKGGIVIANRIPHEASMDPAVINRAIDDALEEMKKAGITGKETTPYLLSKIKDLTSGKSLDANMSLIYNNCKLASRIAKSLCDLSK
jgi:pseudouridine-5'-phosphate glycosidase